jgi:hypothetical protein
VRVCVGGGGGRKCRLRSHCLSLGRVFRCVGSYIRKGALPYVMFPSPPPPPPAEDLPVLDLTVEPSTAPLLYSAADAAAAVAAAASAAEDTEPAATSEYTEAIADAQLAADGVQPMPPPVAVGEDAVGTPARSVGLVETPWGVEAVEASSTSATRFRCALDTTVPVVPTVAGALCMALPNHFLRNSLFPCTR